MTKKNKENNPPTLDSNYGQGIMREKKEKHFYAA
jgi:hypothetical protein